MNTPAAHVQVDASFVTALKALYLAQHPSAHPILFTRLDLEYWLVGRPLQAQVAYTSLLAWISSKPQTQFLN